VAQQASSSIDRARLFRTTPGSTNPAVNADGMALAEDASETSSDDSFGEQVILKKRERVPTVVIGGDASIFYTDNAALTPDNKIDDAFVVANAGISWTPRINPQLEAQLSGHASIFRYNSTSVLDFENLGVGAALFWTPPNCHDVSFFARYDLIELLDRHSEEILQDHEFTFGAQKTFPLGKMQSFTLGVIASTGIAIPASEQRQQLAIFGTYRWQLTKALDAEVSYRVAGYYYNHADRTDGNQVVAANLRYRVSRYADINGFFSFGSNRSDKGRFDYNAVTAGGGIALTFRF
jgi:hypothetical protein